MRATPVGYAINSSTPSHVEERVDDPYDPAAPNDYVEIQKRKELLRTVERRERQRQQHLERLEREQGGWRRNAGPRQKRGGRRRGARVRGARYGARSRWRLEPAGVDEGGGDGGGGGEASLGAGRDCDQEKIKADARAAAAELGGCGRRLRAAAEEIASECGKYGTVDMLHAVDALEGEAAVYIRFTERRAAAKPLQIWKVGSSRARRSRRRF